MPDKDGVRTKTELKADNLWTARSMLYVAHICVKQGIKSGNQSLIDLAEWFYKDAKNWKIK